MEAYRHRQIHDLLMGANHPVFISDERIDGDSLGSSLALVDYLIQHGKQVPVYVSEPVPEQYLGLPHVHHCTHDTSIFDSQDIDLVVVFDCSDAEYVKRLIDLIDGNPTVVNIDHHTTNTNYGDVNQVIVDSPATTDVIHRFFEENKLIISKDAATCLLTGLCFDTGVFTNAATNQQTFDTASSLVLYGARVQDVIRAMFKSRSISALRVWGAALERLDEDRENSTIKTYLTRKDVDNNGVTDDEIDGLSNFLNFVTDADTLHVFRETACGGVKVSMRSRTQDVSEIARQNGGGGHKRAAGYTINNARLICVEEKWEVEHR